MSPEAVAARALASSGRPNVWLSWLGLGGFRSPAATTVGLARANPTIRWDLMNASAFNRLPPAILAPNSTSCTIERRARTWPVRRSCPSRWFLTRASFFGAKPKMAGRWGDIYSAPIKTKAFLQSRVPVHRYLSLPLPAYASDRGRRPYWFFGISALMGTAVSQGYLTRGPCRSFTLAIESHLAPPPVSLPTATASWPRWRAPAAGDRGGRRAPGSWRACRAAAPAA